MKNMLRWCGILVFCLMLNACAVNMGQRANEQEEVFPSHRDDAAIFLASNQNEIWWPLHREVMGQDLFLVNPRRVVRYADGISTVWTKIEFAQAKSASNGAVPIVASLISMQVKCADSTYRSDALYGLSQDGQILEMLSEDMTPFVPLGADTAAARIYQLACIGS